MLAETELDVGREGGRGNLLTDCLASRLMSVLRPSADWRVRLVEGLRVGRGEREPGQCCAGRAGGEKGAESLTTGSPSR